MFGVFRKNQYEDLEWLGVDVRAMHRLGLGLVLFCVVCVQQVQAQRVRWAGDQHKAWSIDVQPIGLDIPFTPIDEDPTGSEKYRALGYSTQVGVRYMLGHHVGIRPHYAYHQFSALGSTEGSLGMHRIGVELVGNLSEFFPYQGVQYFRRFNALVHGGGAVVFGRSGAGNADKMGNVMVGITPQYRLGWRMSVFADATVHATVKQNQSFTGQTLVGPPQNGLFMTIGLGLHYYIGASERHADWR